MLFTAIDPLAFRRACARFATGITVTTVRGPDGEPHGLTVNSFTSVSLTPPLILVCLDHSCTILEMFRNSAYFGVNILRDDQKPVSTRFAQRGLDRFNGTPWHSTDNGVPVLEGVLGFLECRLVQTLNAGDHCILIGEVISAEVTDGRPLLYYNSSYRGLEAEPAGANATQI